MSGQDLLAIAPLIIGTIAGTVVLLAGAFGARTESLHRLAVAGIGAALAGVLAARPQAPRDVTPLLRVDAFALLLWTLLLSIVGILVIVSRDYLRARRAGGEAYYSLLLFGAVGMGVLACSNHFASFFLGLETLTVTLYVLLGYLRRERLSLEAAAKYLILAAMASGLLLFGIALLYAATGSLSFAGVAAGAVDVLRASGVATAPADVLGAPGVATGTVESLGSSAIAAGTVDAPSAADAAATWVIAGALLLLAGFAFKLAVVPFHMWSPDVYQGAPAPVTALIATGSKGAVIAVLLRMIAALPAAPAAETPFGPLLAALAVITMFGGNLLALLQTDVKRLLAYSSVAHIGYIFVALAAGGIVGSEAVVFYTIIYVATTLGAFGVVAVLSSEGTREADALEAYRGLGRRRPGLAAVLAIMLLSLAGIPPTGGFLAKFAILGAAVGADRLGLAIAMAAASAIAIFYYLRVIVVLYMAAPASAAATAGAPDSPRAAPPWSPTSALALAALVAVVLAIGLYPEPWLRAVGAAVASMMAG